MSDNWQQIGEEIGEEYGVSAWYDSRTGWLSIGVNPDWDDSWIIGRPQPSLLTPDGIDRLIQEWIANHP